MTTMRPDFPRSARAAQLVWFDVPCKIWTGARAGTKSGTVPGYGIRKIRGTRRSEGVHRAALEERLGRPIQPGYQACHHCDNSLCYEPLHLFEGTAKDNNDDMAAKGRRRDLPRRTHCKRDHEMSDANTYRWRDKRACRRCRTERTVAARRAKKSR